MAGLGLVVAGLAAALACVLLLLVLGPRRPARRWGWGRWGRSMLDMVSTRVQELRTGPRAPPPAAQQQKLPAGPGDRDADGGPRLSLTGLRRLGYQERNRRRQVAKDNIRKTLSGQNFPIKQTEWSMFWGRTGRPFTGLCCATCTPTSQACFVPEASKAQSLRNVLVVEAQREGGLLARRLCHLSTVWQLQKYDYPQLSGTVLKDERLQQAIEMAAKQDTGETRQHDRSIYEAFLKRHEERATKIVMKMRSTLSDFLLRLTSWLLYKLLPCFLTSVAAHPGQVAMLRSAAQSGLPLVFLPLHRSHLDYILISFILLNNNIRSPLVAAGDNLHIPVFGWLLRGLGAFFIKRRMDPVMGRRDIVYRAVLHTYMVHCLRAGHNMEFFVEGGRTRTGKPSLPKGGLLSVIIDAYMDGTIEDALLVPVSVNYEKLVDGNFVRELLGQPKQMETFTSAVKGIWSVLNSSYGMMRIDFNQPFSLRELVQSFPLLRKEVLEQGLGDRPYDEDDAFSDSNRNSRIPPLDRQLHSVPSSASLFGTDIIDQDHRVLVENIARHIIFDATQSMSIMSTNAVAFLLLSRYRAGVTMTSLVTSLDRLRRELGLADRDMGFTGESIDVVHHALALLGPGLVRCERRVLATDGADSEPEEFIQPIVMLPNVIELAYYANSVLLFYVMDAVLATGLYSLLTFDLYHADAATQAKSHQVEQERLLASAREVCRILQFEFIFVKPCQTLDTVLIEKIDNMRVRDILYQNVKQLTAEEERSYRFARYVENDSSDEEEKQPEPPQVEYRVSAEAESVRQLDFYHGLLRPLIDTYSASAAVLSRLVGRELPEKQLVQEVLTEVKTQLDAGMAHYGESLSVDPIKNSLKLFESWGVLECHTQDRLKLYYLSENWDCEEAVRTIHSTISKYKWVVGNQDL